MSEALSQSEVKILSSLFALFVLPLFGLVFFERNFVVQVCLTVFVALVLGLGAWWLGGRGTYKFKIAGLLSACLAIIMLFALVYSVIFWNVKGSFRLSNELLTENARDNYQTYNAQFLEATKEHYYFTLMRARPSVVRDVFDPSSGVQKDDTGTGVKFSKREPIGENELLEYVHFMTTLSQGQPVSTDNLFVLDAEGKRILYMVDKENTASLQLTEEQRLGHDLLGARTEAKIVEALDGLVRLAERERGENETAMHRIVTLQPNLEVTHFIYFSAAVMTTVGSNDISPNSQATRMLVVLQSLSAVFFFGYALHFLWPEKVKGAD